jgi:hypothetical protein
MIRKLTEQDKQLVLDFAYERERENLFVIGSFRSYTNTLGENHFWGYFDGEQLIGLATHFRRWKSFVVNAADTKVIKQLTDTAIKAGIKINAVPCFKRYADVIIARLESAHTIKPNAVHEEDLLILPKEQFVSFATEGEATAAKKDVDEIIRIDHQVNGKSGAEPISDVERERVNTDEVFIHREDGRIVSQAVIHGYSKNYFQIGGVATLPEYRKRGFAKQVVSRLCETYFEKGIPTALLFVDIDNIAAQKVYASLGFRKDDQFVIAEYTE